MSDEPTEGVLGSLPRTRPHRRSAKRGPAAEPAAPQAPTTTAAAKTKPAATATAKAAAKAKTASAAKTRPKATAKTRTKTTSAAKPPRKPTAKTAGARGPAGQAGAPVRSLQSTTAPRSAGDRSRKPGVTSQAHHPGSPRTDEPPVTRRAAPPAAEPAGVVGTAVQAAAELTEIGLKASARALRGALSRLPRP